MHKNETRAPDQYFMRFQQNHSDTKLIKPGFLVLKEHPFIRCYRIMFMSWKEGCLVFNTMYKICYQK